MKYGILFNQGNVNVGDDIQAYATSNFLPHTDYFIDRERINEFVSDDDEPVGVIMNAWYMWAKWHWPPSKYIVPHFVGFHYADHQLAKQPGSPIKYEFLNGVGGDYLKAYGPIGCRDNYTKGQLRGLGVDAYFSGCITLTLPKQEKIECGKYVCLVDIDPRVTKKIEKQLEGTGIEVKVMTQNKTADFDESWESRLKRVKKLLTTYQNALCVVTKRLHCSLPCLAMEVPVLLVKEMTDDIRFDPYYDYMHRSTVTDFLAGKCDYNFADPPENPQLYKPVREELIRSCEQFVAETKDVEATADELCKTTYTEDEVIRWRHDTMMEAMDNWLAVNRELMINNKYMGKEIDKMKKNGGSVVGTSKYETAMNLPGSVLLKALKTKAKHKFIK